MNYCIHQGIWSHSCSLAVLFSFSLGVQGGGTSVAFERYLVLWVMCHGGMRVVMYKGLIFASLV